ncbi:hypothetical protein ACJW31_04G027900 [Castanea mollissima]
MLCATTSFFLTLSSIASTNGDLLGFIFLTIVPIRNPQNKYKTKTEKLLLCRNPIFITFLLPLTPQRNYSHRKSQHTGYPSLNPKSLFMPSSIGIETHIK